MTNADLQSAMSKIIANPATPVYDKTGLYLPFDELILVVQELVNRATAPATAPTPPTTGGAS